MVVVHMNLGNLTFSGPQPVFTFRFNLMDATRKFVASDIDKDNLTDIIVAVANEMYILRNTYNVLGPTGANASFSLILNVTTSATGLWLVEFADQDGDGWNDIILSSYTFANSSITVLFGNGTAFGFGPPVVPLEFAVPMLGAHSLRSDDGSLHAADEMRRASQATDMCCRWSVVHAQSTGTAAQTLSWHRLTRRQRSA